MAKINPQIVRQIKEAKSGVFTTLVVNKKTILDNGIVCEHAYSVVGRFCDYNNMKSTIEKRANQPQPQNTKRANHNIVVIKDRLTYNTNSKNFLVSFKLDNNPKHTIKSTYRIAGVIVDRDTYFKLNNKVKPSNNSSKPSMITPLLCDIVAIKQ